MTAHLSSLLFNRSLLQRYSLTALLSLCACAPLPKSTSSSLSMEEALDDELNDVIERQEPSKVHQKDVLKRARSKAKLATLASARAARLSPVSEEPAARLREGEALVNALRTSERVVAIELKSGEGMIRCALAPSTLSAALLEGLLKRGDITIKRAQAGLWVATDPTDLAVPLNEPSSSLAPPPPSLPLESRGGDWVAISHKEVLEALILEDPTPWLPPSAYLIGRCEPEEHLKALTRLAVGRDHLPARLTRLTLTHIGWAHTTAPTPP